jgi:hypothetical protein
MWPELLATRQERTALQEVLPASSDAAAQSIAGYAVNESRALLNSKHTFTYIVQGCQVQLSVKYLIIQHFFCTAAWNEWLERGSFAWMPLIFLISAARVRPY